MLQTVFLTWPAHNSEVLPEKKGIFSLEREIFTFVWKDPRMKPRSDLNEKEINNDDETWEESGEKWSGEEWSDHNDFSCVESCQSWQPNGIFQYDTSVCNTRNSSGNRTLYSPCTLPAIHGRDLAWACYHALAQALRFLEYSLLTPILLPVTLHTPCFFSKSLKSQWLFCHNIGSLLMLATSSSIAYPSMLSDDMAGKCVFTRIRETLAKTNVSEVNIRSLVKRIFPFSLTRKISPWAILLILVFHGSCSWYRCGVTSTTQLHWNDMFHCYLSRQGLSGALEALKFLL